LCNLKCDKLWGRGRIG